MKDHANKMKVSKLLFSAVFSTLCVLTNASEEVFSFELAEGGKLESRTSSLKEDPLLVKGKLENGLSYYIRPCAEPKGRVTIRLRVGTGSLSEAEEDQGIAHFIEHLEFNGSKTFKRGDVIVEMQRHGLGLGGDANAYTSFDETVYMMDLPNLEEKTVNLAFTIMRDFCDGALLEDSAIDAERGIIESEYKARDSAGYRALKTTFGFLLKGSRIPERFPIGSLDFIRNSKHDQFRNFYKTHYVPSNMQLILSGDISADQAKAWIDKYFKDMKGQDYNFKLDAGELNLPKGMDAVWIYNDELSSTSVDLGVIRKYEHKEDTASQRIKDLPLDLAFVMLNKRFSRMVNKEDCPFISASMGQQELFKQADIINVSATTSHEKWEKALAAIEQEVRRAVKYGFTREELEEECKSLVNSYEVRCKTWPTVKSNAMAGIIAQGIAGQQVLTDPFEELRILKEGVDIVMKNPELCRIALAKEWAPEVIQAVVTSNVENKDGQKEVLACLKSSLTTEVEALKLEALEPFAYEKIGTPGKVASMKHIDDLDISQYVLSNGIKVNLKPTDFDKDVITIRFSIDGGRVTAPLDKPGIDRFAGVIINQGGLEKHSGEDLARLMAGHSVGVGFSVQNERFVLSGGTTREDLELQLKLMVAHVMHPGYRSEAEMKFRRSLPLMYKNIMHSPDGVLSTKGMSFLLNGNPRLTDPGQEKMEQLTTADVKSWIDSYLKEGYMEVSIVGDFKKEDIIPVLNATLGALPARPDSPKKINHDELAVKMADSGKVENIAYPSEIDRTFACIVWKTKDGFDRQYGRKVNLVNALLKHRLFKGIREKMGEAYSPFVKSSLSMTYPDLGYMMAICPGVLKNKDAVAAAVSEIASQLAEGTIDQDELDRAKLPLINGFERDLRNNGYWIDVIADSQADPEDIEMARTRIEAYKNMSLDEINALVKEIFKKDNSLNINIIPDIKGGVAE